MTGSTKLTLAVALLTLTACANSTALPTNSGAIDRLRGPAADHAAALAGDDMVAARKTGQRLLGLLVAYADW